MLFQGNRAHALIFGIDVARVRIERYLGINDQMLALRQVDDGIGALPTILGSDTDFALVVLTQFQAGAIQHVLQHQLAPITLKFFLTT
ncbi:hypothetical protein D3C85_892720 [compost metagenome]